MDTASATCTGPRRDTVTDEPAGQAVPPAGLRLLPFMRPRLAEGSEAPGSPDASLWDATMRETTRQSVRMPVAGDRGGPRLVPRPWATGETLPGRRATFVVSYSLPSFRAIGRALSGLTKLPLTPDQAFSPVQNQRVMGPAMRADRPAVGPWDRNVSVS